MDTDSELSPELVDLIGQVQHNCDISDANHAGNYTLCIYLLKMREYYRWIHALDFSHDFESDSMTQWLRNKEETWDQVVDEPFKTINFRQDRFDAFDSSAVNDSLHDSKLFYHAGIGQKAVQHFFIADRVEQTTQQNIKITITGKEYARDLTAPPALSTHSEIIVRQESLKRMCWERYQEWNWSRLENPMGTALAYYPFEEDISEALELMTSVEQNTLIQHELGEMTISRDIGPQWSPMMLELLGSKAELLARAVRDHYADCLYTLPFLVEQNNEASIHFYFANLTYIRKDLFPAAMDAYKNWRKNGDPEQIGQVAKTAAAHWHKTLRAILATYQKSEHKPGAQIIELIEHSRF